MKLKRRTVLMVTAVIVVIGVSIIAYSLMCSGNGNVNRVYNDNIKIAEEADYNEIEESTPIIEQGSYKNELKLSGSLTIWSYESSEDFKQQVPYNLFLNSGKAKIVLVSPDNSVTDLIENSDKAGRNENTAVSFKIKKGKNRLKLIGYKKSEIELELKIDKGTFHDSSKR